MLSKKYFVVGGLVLAIALLASIMPVGCKKIDDPLSRFPVKTPIEQAEETGGTPFGTEYQ